MRTGFFKYKDKECGFRARQIRIQSGVGAGGGALLTGDAGGQNRWEPHQEQITWVFCNQSNDKNSGTFEADLPKWLKRSNGRSRKEEVWIFQWEISSWSKWWMTLCLFLWCTRIWRCLELNAKAIGASSPVFWLTGSISLGARGWINRWSNDDRVGASLMKNPHWGNEKLTSRARICPSATLSNAASLH